ncbi:hypothetical protein JTE90_014739 [Oedothorax gibbosus]|uniref:Secreted protein n=1 Tax=Oedothorax gibbosus TaxID=931172 RepID=A0AAV6US50_9ARAC|nr:hypothetical protein JTE90_014739 [Oedothorax gibbosus]
MLLQEMTMKHMLLLITLIFTAILTVHSEEDDTTSLPCVSSDLRKVLLGTDFTMQYLLRVALLSCFFLAAANAQNGDSCLTIDEKGHLEDVLNKVRERLPDPLRLPPRSVSIGVELEDGLLWGLSNLTKLGKADVSCQGSTTIVKLILTTDELKGRYTWSKNVRNQEKSGYVVIISNDFQAEVEVAVVQDESGLVRPELRRLEIRRFKDARIETTGLGFLTWTAGELATLFSGLFQKIIAKSVQSPLKEALERELRDISVNAW